MITYSPADQEWFNRNVPGSLTISPAELVYLSEQSDLSHDLAQLDAICAKPAPEYRPDLQQAMQRAAAQQRVQRIPPPYVERLTIADRIANFFVGFILLGSVLTTFWAIVKGIVWLGEKIQGVM